MNSIKKKWQSGMKNKGILPDVHLRVTEEGGLGEGEAQLWG